MECNTILQLEIVCVYLIGMCLGVESVCFDHLQVGIEHKRMRAAYLCAHIHNRHHPEYNELTR